MTRFCHFTDDPLEPIFSEEQLREPGCKPRGLWISDEGPNAYSWSEWCSSNEFPLGRICYAIEIDPSAKILEISTETEIEAFNNTYRDRFVSDAYDISWIKWREVARKYQGIIIAPYFWSHRIKRGFSWYYGWDCASGCIWDKSAISGVDKRGELAA